MSAQGMKDIAVENIKQTRRSLGLGEEDIENSPITSAEYSNAFLKILGQRMLLKNINAIAMRSANLAIQARKTTGEAVNKSKFLSESWKNENAGLLMEGKNISDINKLNDIESVIDGTGKYSFMRLLTNNLSNITNMDSYIKTNQKLANYEKGIMKFVDTYNTRSKEGTLNPDEFFKSTDYTLAFLYTQQVFHLLKLRLPEGVSLFPKSASVVYCFFLSLVRCLEKAEFLLF